MTEQESDALIGRAIQDHKRLKLKLACLATKADQMEKAVRQGLRLIKGETTGHMKDGSLTVADSPHSMRVSGCDWPTVEAIGDLVSDREETEKRLKEITERLRGAGLADYAV